MIYTHFFFEIIFLFKYIIKFYFEIIFFNIKNIIFLFKQNKKFSFKEK